VRVVVATVLTGLCVTACSASHHSSRPTQPGPPVTAQTSTAPTQYGTITGRYYADGGPPPLGYQPARPIHGTITVSSAQSHRTYHPRENAGGYFTLVVPVGTYEVTGSTGSAPNAMDAHVTVTVRTGEKVDADLGIHMA
jgi:hypothetical protein